VVVVAFARSSFVPTGVGPALGRGTVRRVGHATRRDHNARSLCVVVVRLHGQASCRLASALRLPCHPCGGLGHATPTARSDW